jgi:hypothetical protein
LPDLKREPRKAIYTVVRLVRVVGLVERFLLGQSNRWAEDKEAGRGAAAVATFLDLAHL